MYIWTIDPQKNHLGGGYAHIKANGDVPLYWVAFLQEVLKHRSCFFTKKSLYMGSIFWLSQNFRVFGWQNPKNLKICEKCAYFSRKILNNRLLLVCETKKTNKQKKKNKQNKQKTKEIVVKIKSLILLFLPKWPLKMGRGFEAVHPCPTQIWAPSPLPQEEPPWTIHWIWKKWEYNALSVSGLSWLSG